MIKILLNWGYVKFEKDNRSYMCFRRFDGEKTIYSLYVADVAHRSIIENSINSESLADINKRIEKTKVEISEY